MHTKNIYTAGKPINEAEKALILLHGRGADAQDILGLATHLNISDFALLAPQATNHTWYPYSFLAPPGQNEPWLSSALGLLKELTDEVVEQGIPAENIYFLGFSQGACLTLEFVTRNAKKYGGIVAFTGGLIGDKIYEGNYSGDFEGTPIFLSTGNPDPHVPLERIEESTKILKKMNANLQVKIYENRPHTISQEEIDLANELIF
ncbi:MAG TPA: dienelactone hydrolase family protein [Flavobacteriaceae bacterium]|nr:dienelactone hydrolase family protein [Flavobacteriaceae bacterium]